MITSSYILGWVSRPLEPEQRAERIAKQREQSKGEYARRRAERIEGRTCAICAGPIPDEYRVGRITCSDECRKAQQRQHERRYRKRSGKSIHEKGSPQWRESHSVRVRELWASGGMTFNPRSCKCCSAMFEPASGQQRYCDTDCRQLAAIARRYDVDAAHLRRLLHDQDHRCAICRVSKRGWARQVSRSDGLVVDHCHLTGKVRGFLCGDCNTAIGRFNDDPTKLRRALEYLER